MWSRKQYKDTRTEVLCMLQILKDHAYGNDDKMITVIDDVKIDSFNFIIDLTVDLIKASKQRGGLDEED